MLFCWQATKHLALDEKLKFWCKRKEVLWNKSSELGHSVLMTILIYHFLQLSLGAKTNSSGTRINMSNSSLTAFGKYFPDKKWRFVEMEKNRHHRHRHWKAFTQFSLSLENSFLLRFCLKKTVLNAITRISSSPRFINLFSMKIKLQIEALRLV